MFGLNEVLDLSSDGAALKGFVTRKPISIFSQIKNVKDEKEKLNQLLESLRKKLPEGFKIRAAVSAGDCFFDSVAQGLNELKSNGFIINGKNFNVKSLREDCANSAGEYKDEIIKDANVEDYFVPQKNIAFPDFGNIHDERGNVVPDGQETFDKYLESIKETAEEGKYSIWGRPEIEGKMISNRYGVVLHFYSINEEYGQKMTMTEFTPGNDDQNVFIEGENLDQLQRDNGRKVVRIVNYKKHFVPLLSNFKEDIEEDIEVSRKEVYGIADNKNSHSLIEDIKNYSLEEMGTSREAYGKKQENDSSSKDKASNQVIPMKTVDDGNCFFHAVFGTFNDSSNRYEAGKAQDMREEWHRFLSQFESLNDIKMPTDLKGYLSGKVFTQFTDGSKENDGQVKRILELAKQKNEKLGMDYDHALYGAYLDVIKNQGYFISTEEILVLASLANITIHMYVSVRTQEENVAYEQVFTPDSKIVEGYIRDEGLWGKSSEIAVFHQGVHYSRLPDSILGLSQCDIVTPGKTRFPFKRIENTIQGNERRGTSHSKSPGKENTPLHKKPRSPVASPISKLELSPVPNVPENEDHNSLSDNYRSYGNTLSKTGSESGLIANPTESQIRGYLQSYKLERLNIISCVKKEGNDFKVKLLDFKRISIKKEGNHILPVSIFLKCIKEFFLEDKNFFDAAEGLSHIFSRAKRRFEFYSCVKKSFEKLKESQHCEAELQMFLQDELIPFAFFVWNERATSIYYQHRTSQELGAEGAVVKSVNESFNKLLNNPPNDLENFKQSMEKIQDIFFKALDLPSHIRLNFAEKEILNSNRKDLSQYLVRRFKVIQKYLDSMIKLDLSKEIEKNSFSCSPNSEEIKVLKQISKLNEQNYNTKYQEEYEKIEGSCKNPQVLRYLHGFKIKQKLKCMVERFKEVKNHPQKYLKKVKALLKAEEMRNDFNLLKQELTCILEILNGLKSSSDKSFNTIQDFIDEMAEDDLEYIIYDTRKLFQAWVHIIELKKTYDYQQEKGYVKFLNEFFNKQNFMETLIANRKDKVEKLKEELSRLEKLKDKIIKRGGNELELSFDYDTKDASVGVMPSSDNLSLGDNVHDIDGNASVGIIPHSDNFDRGNETYNLIKGNLKEGCDIYDGCFLKAALSVIAGNIRLLTGQSEEGLIKILEDKKAKNIYRLFDILITKNSCRFEKFRLYKNGEVVPIADISKSGVHIKVGEAVLSRPYSSSSFVNNLISSIEKNMDGKLIDSQCDSLEADVSIIDPQERSFSDYLVRYYKKMIGRALSGEVLAANESVVCEGDELLKKPFMCLYVDNLISKNACNEEEEEKVKNLVLNTYRYYQDYWDKHPAIKSKNWHPLNQGLVLVLCDDEPIQDAYGKATNITNDEIGNKTGKERKEILKRNFLSCLEIRCEWDAKGYSRKCLDYRLQRKAFGLAFEEIGKEFCAKKFREALKEKLEEKLRVHGKDRNLQLYDPQEKATKERSQEKKLEQSKNLYMISRKE